MIADAAPRPIRIMPPLLASQIAAGEVVERPASVVKELVENSLDAGAGRVVVELEQGGIELVRVTDDGHGIPEAELALAFTPHATSKLQSTEDLDRIATMGFRGEALASIASVARTTIRSRTAGQAGAAEIAAEGHTLGAARPAGGAVGTCVTVRNLFFNTPARRKFLRTPPTEQGRCLDVLRDLALAHPGIGLRVISDGKVTLDLPPEDSPRRRAVAVLGRELEGELLECSLDVLDGGGAAGGAGLVIWGLVGKPSLARHSAGEMHVFVNGRAVRDKTIHHALREAYRGLIEPGRYPTAVLLIDMDPARVDVNVHPAKAEVRFRDSSAVHQGVLRAVRRALQEADLTPDFGVGGSAFRAGPFGVSSDPRAILPTPSAAPAAPPRVVDAGAFVDYFRRVGDLGVVGRLSEARGGAAAAAEGREKAEETQPARQAGPPLAEPAALAEAKPINPALQVHNSFLVTQDEQGVVIIDQHALHERVMFEKLLARVQASPGGLERQHLLAPVVVPAAARQVEALETLQGLLARIGIEAEPMGPESIGVRAFATFLFERGVDPGPFVLDLLDKAGAAGFAPDSEEALRDVLDMMACKAAVKAGDGLSDMELAELVALRDRIERSSNCPHGRPTSVRLTIRELEKLFGRS